MPQCQFFKPAAAPVNYNMTKNSSYLDAAITASTSLSVRV